MGMYTEFHFNAELRQDVPEEILAIIDFMLLENSRIKNLKIITPSHPLFETPRWKWMLLCDSYYFSADTHSTLRTEKLGGSTSHYLCIRCNLKNYDSEIEKFVDWIDPYLYKESGDFLGFSRYEESEEPTIIRKK